MLPLHGVGRGDAQQAQSVTYDDLRGERKTHARIPQRRIIDQELMRAVVGVKVVGQIAKVVHQRMRGTIRGGVLDGLGKGKEMRLMSLCSCGSLTEASAPSPRAGSCTMPRSSIWRRTLETRACAYWM